MKKIYFIGDIVNNTGPAMVNKSYYPYLKKYAVFCKSNNKIYRMFHFLINILFRKKVIVSGFSKFNYLQIKLSNLLHKKVYYLMHGFIKEEIKYINIVDKEKKINYEYKYLKSVSTIICVSEIFSHKLMKEYPEFKNKIMYLNNGFDSNIKKIKVKHSTYTIISVGGGMRRKNNIAVCEAIKKINRKIKFVVIGSIAEDGNKIKEYPFVEYYDNLTHKDVLNKMFESDLYVQNSYFETFGLAVVEALQCGCDLLLSKDIGALNILKNIDDEHIVCNNDDIDEIKNKILSLMEHNYKSNIYIDDFYSCENACKRLIEMMW